MTILNIKDIFNLPKALEKFWERVDKKEEDECWLWTGSVKDGYGIFSVTRKSDGEVKTMRSNRFAWLVIHGSIPENMCVCHTCDTRKCCNPNHLWLGTKGENNTDMFRKGRGVAGGIVGLKPSKETREKMSESARKKWERLREKALEQGKMP